jgi:hypothetical protein
MKTEGISIKVQLPRPGDKEFELLVSAIESAVLKRIIKRLQQDTENAQGDNKIT